MGELERWSKHKIISRHLLADDTEQLEAFDVRPEDCTTGDIHWVHRQARCLCMINGIQTAGRPYVSPAASALFDTRRRFRWTFNITTHETPITRVAVEAVLDNLARWLDVMGRHFRVEYPRQTTIIAHEDLVHVHLPDVAWRYYYEAIASSQGETR
jgi:hypothetical protein